MDSSQRLVLLSATQQLGKALQKAGRDGQETVRERGLDGFLREFHKRDYTFCPLNLIPVYFQAFSSVGVKSRAELEREWNNCRDEEMSEAVSCVLRAEREYHQLLAQVDELVQKEDDDRALPAASVCKVGSKLPADLSFMDPISEEPVTLEAVCNRSQYTLFVLMRHLA